MWASYKGYRSWKRLHGDGDEDGFVVLKGVEYDTIDAGHILVVMPEGVNAAHGQIHQPGEEERKDPAVHIAYGPYIDMERNHVHPDLAHDEPVQQVSKPQPQRHAQGELGHDGAYRQHALRAGHHRGGGHPVRGKWRHALFGPCDQVDGFHPRLRLQVHVLLHDAGVARDGLHPVQPFPRLFMMIVGISGCTALLVTGFGVKDSIADIGDRGPCRT